MRPRNDQDYCLIMLLDHVTNQENVRIHISIDSTYHDSRVRQLTDRFNDYRRRRNSFIWYSLGFYFYNVFDALVDAHLHDFDDRPDISLRPDCESPGLHMSARFRIKAITTNKGG